MAIAPEYAAGWTRQFLALRIPEPAWQAAGHQLQRIADWELRSGDALVASRISTEKSDSLPRL